LSAQLEEKALYGFLSARFGEETGLTSDAVRSFMRSCPSDTDVVILAPHVGWDSSALFLNIIEQGDFMHAGLLAAAQAAFDVVGFSVDAARLVSDSRTLVLGNYFLATPRFWRRWLEINEKLFALAEDQSAPAGAKLRTPSTHQSEAEPVGLKVFVMERIAAL